MLFPLLPLLPPEMYYFEVKLDIISFHLNILIGIFLKHKYNTVIISKELTLPLKIIQYIESFQISLLVFLKFIYQEN